MKYDLHIHSCLSPCGDSEMTPFNIVGMLTLSGVKLAALTDHNTTLNCPAFFKACGQYGIIPLGGMELTTAEDIHVVCLFPELETTMSFGETVAAHRMKIKNRPDIFGDQQIVDENDSIVGCVEDLLVAGTDLDISSAYDLVKEYGGIAYPAHIDKQSNGLIAILGDFPPEPVFSCAEFHDPLKIPELVSKYTALKDMRHLVCSDAHYLHTMLEEPNDLAVKIDEGRPDLAGIAVIEYLKGNKM